MCAASVAACDVVDLGVSHFPGKPGSGGGGDITDAGPGEVPASVYVTGLEYPEGYDWRRDPGYGSVECTLFMMKDGKRVLELPVGYAYDRASEPDMHRCIDGHLYTDYSTDGATVVQKDGHELFRYDGREMVPAFHVSGNDVHTLGVPRDGASGFTYRCNGKVVLSRSKGYPVSGFHTDAGHLYFTFMEPVSSPDGTVNRYCLSEDGTVTVIGSPGDGDVAAARMIDGRLYYIMIPGGGRSVVIYAGEDTYYLDMPYEDMDECSIMYDGADVFVYGLCRSGSIRSCCLWKGGRLVGSIPYSYEPGCAFADGGTFHAVMGEPYFGEPVRHYTDGEADFVYGTGYGCPSRGAAVMADDKFYAILNPYDNTKKPSVWEGGNCTEYDFNGYFTSVSSY